MQSTARDEVEDYEVDAEVEVEDTSVEADDVWVTSDASVVVALAVEAFFEFDGVGQV